MRFASRGVPVSGDGPHNGWMHPAPTASPPIRSRRGAIALLLALAVVGAACGESGFRYVGTSGDNVFLRVPADWTVFTPREMLEASGLEDGTYRWVVGFDAGPEPNIDRVLLNSAEFPEFPVVMSFVRGINPGERDGFSLGSIRNAQFQIDGFVSEGRGEFLNYGDDVTFDGGFHGARDKFRITFGVGARTSLTVDQIGVVDPTTNSLYYVAAWCTSPCFADQQSQIDQVLQSWTVEEK